MEYVLVLAAVIFMAAGHLIKTLRWAQIIGVYEKPNTPWLLFALGIGHTVNAALPVRVGDLFRFALAGRKMQNGYSFALATTIVDIYIDALVASGMFVVLSILGIGGEMLQETARGFAAAFLVLLPVTLLAMACRHQVKRLIHSISKVFNTKIEYRLLYVSYLVLAAFKDILRKVSKLRFCLYTVLLWSCYVVSYVLFAQALQYMGQTYIASDVFRIMFTQKKAFLHMGQSPSWVWAVYVVLPLVLCVLIWCGYSLRRSAPEVKERRKILPQVTEDDRLQFLELYYQDEKRDSLHKYLEINRDVSIIKDVSAGSAASTLLVMREGELFFRKYAFGRDGAKLKEQMDWIRTHKADIPLPEIVHGESDAEYCVYDMPCPSGTCGLFQYIHTMPETAVFALLERALLTLDQGIHSKNCRAAEQIETYVREKAAKNYAEIRNGGRYIRELEKHGHVLINGRAYPTLAYYEKMLSPEHLETVFRNDTYADIHGDLTVENMICRYGQDGEAAADSFYFIDPNTGNLHDSPFLDYAKLLQSLHGNYEFLMMVRDVQIEENEVNFLNTGSAAYEKCYQHYREFLQSRFSDEAVKSIYYHEIVHWLRLLPYKIRKDEKLAVVFYCGLLKILADIREMYDETESGDL